LFTRKLEIGVGFENYLITIEEVFGWLRDVPERTRVSLGDTSKTEI